MSCGPAAAAAARADFFCCPDAASGRRTCSDSLPDTCRGRAYKVFDNGGWLMPGEMGINLSSRPEPIFNSPQQLLRFAGSNLSELVPAASP